MIHNKHTHLFRLDELLILLTLGYALNKTF